MLWMGLSEYCTATGLPPYYLQLWVPIMVIDFSSCFVISSAGLAHRIENPSCFPVYSWSLVGMTAFLRPWLTHRYSVFSARKLSYQLTCSYNRVIIGLLLAGIYLTLYRRVSKTSSRFTNRDSHFDLARFTDPRFTIHNQLILGLMIIL
jgi:hypothetical protein